MFKLISKESCKSSILRFLITLFILLIFYDAIFRKWITPSLSNIIMPIKIFVCILIILKGYKYVKSYTVWEKSFAFIGCILFFTSLMLGHGNLYVTIWGCLPYWIGLTCCYTLGKILSINDIKRIGVLIVYTAIFHSILTIIQFTLPVNHFLNVGAAAIDQIAEMTAGELSGMFRPQGIFMTTAPTFMLLALSFILYFLNFSKGVISRKILILSFVLTVTAAIFSTSRSTIFVLSGLLLYFIFFCVNKRISGNIIKYMLVIIPFMFLITLTPLGKIAINNMGNRFSNASETVSGDRGKTTKGNLLDIYNRTVGYNINAILDPHTLDGERPPFWGYGQGISTQTGGRLLGNTKHSGFALAEWDGLRIMCESGYLFGWIVIYIRMAYVCRFLPKLSLMKRSQKMLAMMLFPSFFISFFLSNTWGNAFNACIAFLIGGMFLSAYSKGGKIRE